MKKKKIMQKSKKVFSAVIAASVIVSSTVPETILAAEINDVEVAVEAENEDLTAEAETEAADDELTVIEDDQAPVDDVELTADDVETEMVDDFTESGTDVYGFADGEAVFSDAETAEISASVQELQSRINALPTVEEFKNMAGGEPVEGSILNQSQMDVYNEVQSIYEAYDGLTEDEQAQVDTDKLEALCEYFNAQTDTTLSITPSTVNASGLTLYKDSVRSVDVGFQWPNYAGVPISLVVLDKNIGANSLVYSGYDAETYEESLAKVNANVVSKSAAKAYQTSMGEYFNGTYVFNEGEIPLNTDKTYYLYVWTYYGRKYYPDVQVLQIKVKNGEIFFGKPSTTDADSFEEIKFNVQLTVNMEGWTYGENAKVPKVTSVIVNNEDITDSYKDADITYTYYTDSNCQNETTEEVGATKEGGVPSCAGTYYVKATVAAQGEYPEGYGTTSFKIEKAEQKAPVVGRLLEAIKGANDGAICNVDSTMEYRKEGDTEYTAIEGDMVLNLAPGMYYVRYREDANHKASEDCEVKISEGRMLKIVIPGPWEQIGYTLTTDKGEACWHEAVTLTFSLKEGYSKTSDFSVKVNNRPVSLEENGTFKITNPETDILITVNGVADITAPVVTGVENDATYTGTVEFTAEDVNLDKVTVDGREVTPDENGKYTLIPKSGAYTITATDKAGNVTEIKNVTVNWQEVEIPEANSKTYTGDTLTADLADTETYTVVENKGGVNAGSYDVVLELTDPVNYKWQGKDAGVVQTTVGFEITKADLTDITAPETKTDLVYNGQKQALLTEGKVTGGTLIYKVDDGEWTEEIPTATDAGEYQIAYKIVTDANHHNDSPEEKQLTVTIAPKEATVTAVDAKKNVGAKDPKLTYKAEGLVGEDTLTNIVISRKKGEKAGTYAITVSQKDGANPNYSITFKNAVFTIVQQEISVQQLIKMNLPILTAKGTAAKNAVTVSWQKVSGATGYEVYWAYCDGKQNFKKLADVTNGKTKVQHKKLNKNHEYKYFVAAYKTVNGQKTYIAKSATVHVALKQAAKTNVKAVSVNKQKVVLRKGKTFRIRAGAKLENTKKTQILHTSAFRYYVADPKVATVSANGKIKAAGKGTTVVYVIANSGAYKKVRVTVK